MGPNLLWTIDGKWWFRVNALPFEKMEDRDDIWKNVTSRSVLDKKHKKKRYIFPNCYLRQRYVWTCEEITWKQRFASAKVFRRWIYSQGAIFLEENNQSLWIQPSVAYKSRPLRGRKPSKTGNHPMENFVDRKFPIFRAALNFLLPVVEEKWRRKRFASSSSFSVTCGREVK